MQHTLTLRNNLGDTITMPLGIIRSIERNDRHLTLDDGSESLAVLVFDREQAAKDAEADAINALGEYLAALAGLRVEGGA